MKRRKSDRRVRDRLQIKIIESIAKPTLGFELENFQHYGQLRKTATEIHNTLPSYASKLMYNVLGVFSFVTRFLTSRKSTNAALRTLLLSMPDIYRNSPSFRRGILKLI